MSNNKSLPIVKLTHAIDLPLPSYATTFSAGMDLLASNNDDIIIDVSDRVLVPTGISIGLPRGFEAQVRPRSGLALKHGVTVLNAPGTIDADYRGEVSVILINHGSENFTIHRGMRIAQLVISPIMHASWSEVSELKATDRGDGGFGSTGN